MLRSFKGRNLYMKLCTKCKFIVSRNKLEGERNDAEMLKTSQIVVWFIPAHIKTCCKEIPGP